MGKQNLTEEEVKQKLGIKDFREITKAQVVELCSTLPDLDPEVAKKVLEQFPKYAETMTEMVKVYADFAKKILENGREGAREYYNACNQILGEIQRQLQEPNLTEEQRDKLNEKMFMVARMISEKDSEGKNFLLKTIGVVSTVVLGALGLVAAVIGVSSKTGGKGGTKA